MKSHHLFIFAVIGLSSVRADTTSFVGNLRDDANVISCGSGCTLGASNTDGDYAQWAAVVDSFTVSTVSDMQAVTFSYGGGVNGAGTTIAQGGFEPYLSLFDSSGDFLASTFFGTTCPPGANTNTDSGQCFDVSLDGGTLAPGSYQIAISAYENMSFAENSGTGTLADGFTGLGNLAGGEDLHYAFDVVLSSATPVPEPSAGWMLGGIVLAVVGLGRKSRKWRQQALGNRLCRNRATCTSEKPAISTSAI
ncbi:MAG TPA: DVUA0089 family protein [Bryobacteraceae bacterium]|nr:DVUA0089 family protein [Bryobacteraceae bacterium]